jgi:hypothetical protein
MAISALGTRHRVVPRRRWGIWRGSFYILLGCASQAGNHPQRERAAPPESGGELNNGSPPQMRRGDALAAGVVLSRKCTNSRKPRMTAKRTAANRANGARSRGPVTPAGRERAAVARLRHGYYSQAAEVALTALGEDPAEFRRRLDSLIAASNPANALEMGLVMQTARSLWRMERFHRIAESQTVQRVEQVMAKQRQAEAIRAYPLIGKLERLKQLLGAICVDFHRDAGPEEMQLFEQCRGDVSAAKADAIKRLLLRLRPLCPAADPPAPPTSAEAIAEVPAAEGEERMAVRRELLVTLGQEIESTEKSFLGTDQDSPEAQIERDNIVASALPEAEFMNRAEESSLRQVWRATELLRKVKKAARAEMTPKIEDEPVM